MGYFVKIRYTESYLFYLRLFYGDRKSCSKFYSPVQNVPAACPCDHVQNPAVNAHSSFCTHMCTEMPMCGISNTLAAYAAPRRQRWRCPAQHNVHIDNHEFRYPCKNVHPSHAPYVHCNLQQLSEQSTTLMAQSHMQIKTAQTNILEMSGSNAVPGKRCTN